LGVSFRVPKSWERLQSSGDAKEIFVFDTAPAKKRRTPSRTAPRPQAARYFHLYLGQPCERQKQLAEVVKDTRSGIQRMNPGVTFRKDEATDLAGRQAWTFVWPQKQTFTVTEVRNGKSTQRQTDLEVWRQKTLWLQNDTICEYGVESDPATFPTMEKLAAQVRDSIEWSEPAKPASGS
jgi:hypothetical protein